MKVRVEFRRLVLPTSHPDIGIWCVGARETVVFGYTLKKSIYIDKMLVRNMGVIYVKVQLWRGKWWRAPTLLACFQKVLFDHSSCWSSKRINDGTLIMAKYIMYIHTWLNWAWFFVNNKYHPNHSIAHKYSSISVSIPAMEIITYWMQTIQHIHFVWKSPLKRVVADIW